MPSFYCENCGKEVPADVSSCPYCGKRFFSVKCPVCSYSGPAPEFTKGCPSCGYLRPPEDLHTAGEHETPVKEKKQLPRWVYRVLLFSMLAGLGVLVKIYLSL